MSNARDYLINTLSAKLNTPEDEYVPRRPVNLDILITLNHLLGQDAGAGDGCSVGDVLAEMPIDSNCGDVCEKALNAAVELTLCLVMAYGTDRIELIENVLTAAIEACCCFIRG